MNTKRYVSASLAAFAVIFILDFVLHGTLLKGLYEQTMQLWRPEAEYKGYMHWMILSQLLFAFSFTYIFTKGYENKGIAEGVRYGILIALLFSAHHLGAYSYMPLLPGIVIGWILGSIVELGIAGAAVAAIYRPKTPGV